MCKLHVPSAFSVVIELLNQTCYHFFRGLKSLFLYTLTLGELSRLEETDLGSMLARGTVKIFQALKLSGTCSIMVVLVYSAIWNPSLVYHEDATTSIENNVTIATTTRTEQIYSKELFHEGKL